MPYMGISPCIWKEVFSYAMIFHGKPDAGEQMHWK